MSLQNRLRCLSYQAIKTPTVEVLIHEKRWNAVSSGEKNINLWEGPMIVFCLAYTLCPYRIKDTNVVECHCFLGQLSSSSRSRYQGQGNDQSLDPGQKNSLQRLNIQCLPGFMLTECLLFVFLRCLPCFINQTALSIRLLYQSVSPFSFIFHMDLKQPLFTDRS